MINDSVAVTEQRRRLENCVVAHEVKYAGRDSAAPIEQDLALDVKRCKTNHIEFRTSHSFINHQTTRSLLLLFPYRRVVCLCVDVQDICRNMKRVVNRRVHNVAVKEAEATKGQFQYEGVKKMRTDSHAKSKLAGRHKNCKDANERRIAYDMATNEEIKSMGYVYDLQKGVTAKHPKCASKSCM